MSELELVRIVRSWWVSWMYACQDVRPVLVCSVSKRTFARNYGAYYTPAGSPRHPDTVCMCKLSSKQPEFLDSGLNPGTKGDGGEHGGTDPSIVLRPPTYMDATTPLTTSLADWVHEWRMMYQIYSPIHSRDTGTSCRQRQSNREWKAHRRHGCVYR